MIRKKTFWISILLTVFILSVFLISIGLNRAVKDNYAAPDTSTETNDAQKSTINIPEYFSAILSKDSLIMPVLNTLKKRLIKN